MEKERIILTRAKHMRTYQTNAEKIIWAMLRRNQLGCKFKRQQPMKNYISDFVCFDKKLIIEIDGGQHRTEKDAARTQFLEGQGFTVLRFWNNEVLENRDGGHDIIRQKLAHPLSLPSPTRGEGSNKEN